LIKDHSVDSAASVLVKSSRTNITQIRRPELVNLTKSVGDSSHHINRADDGRVVGISKITTVLRKSVVR
jgi:hypothetical protein